MKSPLRVLLLLTFFFVRSMFLGLFAISFFFLTVNVSGPHIKSLFSVILSFFSTVSGPLLVIFLFCKSFFFLNQFFSLSFSYSVCSVSFLNWFSSGALSKDAKIPFSRKGGDLPSFWLRHDYLSGKDWLCDLDYWNVRPWFSCALILAPVLNFCFVLSCYNMAYNEDYTTSWYVMVVPMIFSPCLLFLHAIVYR